MNIIKLCSLREQYSREHAATGDKNETDRLRRIILSRLVDVIDAVLEESS